MSDATLLATSAPAGPTHRAVRLIVDRSLRVKLVLAFLAVKVLSVIVAAPIYGSETANVIGVRRTTYTLNILLDFLQSTRYGQTGKYRYALAQSLQQSIAVYRL